MSRSTQRRRNSTGRGQTGGNEGAGLLTESDGGTVLAVRVIPGAKKTMVAGEENGRLKVRLQAPPIEGKANRELLKTLAGVLGLRKNQVRLLRGERSRDKSVMLSGIDADEIRNRLKKALRVE